MADDAAGLAPSRVNAPSKVPKLPRTLATMAWRAWKPIVVWVESIAHVPVMFDRSFAVPVVPVVPVVVVTGTTPQQNGLCFN